MDAERIDAILRKHDRLDAAGLTTYAYHKPEMLRQEELRFQAELGGLESREEVISKALAMHQQLLKIPGFLLPENG